MAQVFNPYLPINEYIPDGEPHVFGARVYLYGSHDAEGGYTFCMRDYVTYSASVTNLKEWRYEGVIYRADQDPQYPKLKYMYAPDVVCGNDGKYYLYYAMGGDYGYGGYIGPISVAVADSPVGPFAFLGFVRNADGTPMEKYVCFDPAVLNDDGVIRLYYGTQYGTDGSLEVQREPAFEKNLMEMFGKSAEEIRSYPDNVMGPITAVLCDDMLTVKEEPKHLIPYHVKGTPFEAHPFFEASSMRKVGEKYYFIYSSWLNHELCYAVSDRPDGGFVFGGTIVSNGDVGMNDRAGEERLNMTGTTHGSIIELNGRWYVFYHRLTHKSDYSRQACAEKITILPDGRIPQVEITSCGLNDGPLKAEGRYPAVIACNLTNGHMPTGSNSIYRDAFPNVNHLGDERFIAEIEHGTLIGYKYFDLPKRFVFGVTVRAENEENLPKYEGPVRLDERSVLSSEPVVRYASDRAISSGIGVSGADVTCTDAGISSSGYFEVRTSEFGDAIGRIELTGVDGEWTEFEAECTVRAQNESTDKTGTPAKEPGKGTPIYLIYHGSNKVQLREIFFREA